MANQKFQPKWKHFPNCYCKSKMCPLKSWLLPLFRMALSTEALERVPQGYARLREAVACFSLFR